ncbi:MAG TPA: rhodanese-like domain-containing protein [Pseudogracilibacillus sp.]|nr:rhodanese-like domain-containing protein [Pseudogracilibacillus sp.]
MRKSLILLAILFTFVACNNDTADDIEDVNDPASPSQVSLKYETIDLEAVEDYVADGYIVADVREIDEFNEGHIPGAVHAPLSDLENNEFGPLQVDEKYVIICRSGNRSIAASNILIQEGFDIVNVSEGMSTWTGEIEY